MNEIDRLRALFTECAHPEALADLAALQQRLAELERDRERLKAARQILFAYEAMPEGNEITAHPWWAVVRKGSFGRMVVLEGPFFSRERATQLLDARRYQYGDKAFVYCFSGDRSQHYRELREALCADAARAGEEKR